MSMEMLGGEPAIHRNKLDVAGKPWKGIGSLTVLPFREGTPYQGEDLVYDGNAPGFLVRCTRQVGSTPGTCLYERWIETAKVVLRFPRDWLADWRTVAANSERLIENLRPSHR
jgi:hypothetical protein